MDGNGNAKDKSGRIIAVDGSRVAAARRSDGRIARSDGIASLPGPWPARMHYNDMIKEQRQ